MLIVWSNSGTSFLWTISLVGVSGYHVHSTKPIISVATSTIDATACVCTQCTPTITVYITLTSYLVWATWWLARELLYIVIYTLNYCHIWLTGGSDSEQHSILHVSQDHKTWSELEYEDSASHSANCYPIKSWHERFANWWLISGIEGLNGYTKQLRFNRWWGTME